MSSLASAVNFTQPSIIWVGAFLDQSALWACLGLILLIGKWCRRVYPGHAAPPWGSVMGHIKILREQEHKKHIRKRGFYFPSCPWKRNTDHQVEIKMLLHKVVFGPTFHGSNKLMYDSKGHKEAFHSSSYLSFHNTLYQIQCHKAFRCILPLLDSRAFILQKSPSDTKNMTKNFVSLI